MYVLSVVDWVFVEEFNCKTTLKLKMINLKLECRERKYVSFGLHEFYLLKLPELHLKLSIFYKS